VTPLILTVQLSIVNMSQICKNIFFSDVTACSLLDRYHCFGATLCLRYYGRAASNRFLRAGTCLPN